MQTLDLNEIARLASTWWEPDGSAEEPSAITLTLTKPDGTSSTVLKAAMTGSESVAGSGTLDVWTALATVDQAGVWRYEFEGVINGVPVTQPEKAFLVGVDDQRAPCEPWCTWAEVEACPGTVNYSGLDSPTREMILDSVSEVLFNLTDGVYPGICETTRSLCFACSSCGPTLCGCDAREQISLGGRYPVWAAWDVVDDGDTLDPSAYTIRSRRYLVRLDGRSWPRWSSSLDPLDPTNFRATWASGRRVPTGGRRAAATLAAELAKACLDLPCQLPSRMTQVSTEGATYTLLDSMKMIEEGRTGLYYPDLWIAADKAGRKPRPGFFSPGAAGARRSP